MDLIRKKQPEWEQILNEEVKVKENENLFWDKNSSENESKKIKWNSALKELEFYNSLSPADKEKYTQQKLKKKQLFVNLICLALVLALGFWWKFYLESHLNSIVNKNLELRTKSDQLQTDIKWLSKTEELLEDVAVSWLMSKAIFDQRDEVLDLLESVEALTPNNLTFKLWKIQRLSKNNYKIEYELVPKEDASSLNKAIVDTAFMIETLQESKTILSVAKRDEHHFVINEFKWTTYSKSTKTFPLSLSVTMVENKKTWSNEKDNKQKK